MATCVCGQPGAECICCTPIPDAGDLIVKAREARDAMWRVENEVHVRRIVREEIAAYFRKASTVTIGDGTLPYREYLATRDEPPAAPPVAVRSLDDIRAAANRASDDVDRLAEQQKRLGKAGGK